MLANNVIAFPKAKTAVAEEGNCDEIVDMAMEQAMTAMRVYYDHSINDKDIGLIVEAIRSKVYRDHSIHHPLQDLAERLITIVE